MAAYCFNDSQLEEALGQWLRDAGHLLISDIQTAAIHPEAAKQIIRTFLASPEMAKARIADKPKTKGA